LAGAVPFPFHDDRDGGSPPGALSAPELSSGRARTAERKAVNTTPRDKRNNIPECPDFPLAVAEDACGTDCAFEAAEDASTAGCTAEAAGDARGTGCALEAAEDASTAGCTAEAAGDACGIAGSCATEAAEDATGAGCTAAAAEDVTGVDRKLSPPKSARGEASGELLVEEGIIAGGEGMSTMEEVLATVGTDEGTVRPVVVLGT
jgi:hypothetical protein